MADLTGGVAESGLRILKLNPALDASALADEYRQDQRIQIRDLLEDDAAGELARMLAQRTPWGLSWQAGDDGPHRIRQDQMASMSPQQVQHMSGQLHRAMQGDDFAFIYSQYRMSVAYVEGWSSSPDHDLLLAELNSEPLLDLVRVVTGLPQIKLCDAQVSHYGPNQFLSLHQDINTEENEDRLIAYVLNLCPGPWRPDWGGYLNFFNDDGDIVHGYLPRFNCLNLFRVPRHHNVSYVPPFAAGNRLAVTGWFRTR